MADLILGIGLDPQFLLLILVMASLGVVLLFGRFRLSYMDSLLFFMVAQIANISIIFCLPMEETLRWQMLSYMLALWIGFSINGRPLTDAAHSALDENSFYDLRLLLLLLAAAIVVANLYLGATVGFPLFSANPSEDKFTVYSGGLGLVRHLNMGPYVFLCAGCSLMILRNRYRRQMALALVLPTLLIMMGGGKSALLPVLFAFSYAIAHPCLEVSNDLRRKAGLYLGILLGVASALALLVTTKDSGGVQSGFQQLLIRLLLSADVILYYVPHREMVQGMVDANIWGYLHNTFAVPLGLLRISDYSAALGSIIQDTDNGGPNVEYIVQADLFMGPILGIIYCIAVGYAVSWLRSHFVRKSFKSAITEAIALFFALVAFDMAIEVGLFVGEVFVTSVFVLALYGLVILFRTAFQSVDKILPELRLTSLE